MTKRIGCHEDRIIKNENIFKDTWTGFLRIGGAKFAMTCQTPRW